MPDFIKGPLEILTGTESGTISMTKARWAVGAYSFGAAALASIITRKRVAAGDEPIAGFLF